MRSLDFNVVDILYYNVSKLDELLLISNKKSQIGVFDNCLYLTASFKLPNNFHAMKSGILLHETPFNQNTFITVSEYHPLESYRNTQTSRENLNIISNSNDYLAVTLYGDIGINNLITVISTLIVEPILLGDKFDFKRNRSRTFKPEISGY